MHYTYSWAQAPPPLPPSQPCEEVAQRCKGSLIDRDGYLPHKPVHLLRRSKWASVYTSSTCSYLYLKGTLRASSKWPELPIVCPSHSHFSIYSVPKGALINMQLLTKQSIPLPSFLHSNFMTHTAAVAGAVCVTINWKQPNTTLACNKRFLQFRSNQSCFPELPRTLLLRTLSKMFLPIKEFHSHTLSLTYGTRDQWRKAYCPF